MLPNAALIFLAIQPQQPTHPPVNQRILDFTVAQEGKKVDRGECWDLAATALNAAGAKWDGMYGFGRQLDPQVEALLPGDIVQFEGVLMEHRTENSREQFSFMKHTAVVTTVTGPGEVVIMHQNFGQAGRKVSSLRLILSNLVKGQLLFYRPVP